MRKIIILVIVLLSFTIETPCFAMQTKKVTTDKAYYTSSNWEKEPLYSNQFGGKLAFGLLNSCLGIFEFVKQPYESATLGDNVLIGVARGIYYAFADIIGGALNAATFPITALKIPLPKGGVESREF